jgi:hypothetical protein
MKGNTTIRDPIKWGGSEKKTREGEGVGEDEGEDKFSESPLPARSVSLKIKK